MTFMKPCDYGIIKDFCRLGNNFSRNLQGIRLLQKQMEIRIGKPSFIVLLTILLWTHATGQTKIITGVVLDSVSHTPLPNVSVCVKTSSKCVLSDNKGMFRIIVGNKVHFI